MGHGGGDERKHGATIIPSAVRRSVSPTAVSSGMSILKVASKDISCEQQQHNPNLSVCVVHYPVGDHGPAGTRRVHLQKQLRPRVPIFFSRFDVVEQLLKDLHRGNETINPGAPRWSSMCLSLETNSVGKGELQNVQQQYSCVIWRISCTQKPGWVLNYCSANDRFMFNVKS